MEIDARGQVCPQPVLMAEEALSKIDAGVVRVLVDNKAPVKSLLKFAKKNGLNANANKEGESWVVNIQKGHSSDVSATEKTLLREDQGTEKEKAHDEIIKKNALLVVASDIMGREEDIGKVLMKGFFETIKATKELPDTIFFLNSGVKLTTINEDVYPILKEIESMGAEIFSCGTCLKHYDLESQLKVGYRGTTNHIVEGIKDFDRTVWIG